MLVAAEFVVCECDPVVIGRVMGNLVDNAIKFTPEGGHIRVPFTQDETQVKVTVSATSFGIPPEFRDRVFEKFAQVEALQRQQMYSTGLGRSIRLDSQLNEGSAFWFVLPKNSCGEVDGNAA